MTEATRRENSYVPQRGTVKDCAIATLATITGETYERIAAELQLTIDTNTGVPIDLPTDGIDLHQTIYALFRLGWYAAPILSREKAGKSGYPDNDAIRLLLRGGKAVIAYNDSEVGEHTLAWDGAEAVDCSNGQLVCLSHLVIEAVVVLTPVEQARG